MKVTARHRQRKDYSKYNKVHQIPNLVEVQRNSFERFLQIGEGNDRREDTGLQAVFKSVFPIKDYNDTASLEFVGYEFGEPKYDMYECIQRGMTWAIPLKVTIQLVLWDNAEDGSRTVRDIKEQEVYFGEIPLMSDKGTFIINGSERVVVSQLQRSPGVFFSHDKGASHSSGKLLHSARIIPYRGSWLDFEFDVKDILHCRIDRKRKQHASILIRALGWSTEKILNHFYKKDSIRIGKHGEIVKKFIPELVEGLKAFADIKGKDGKVVIKEGQKINKGLIRRAVEAGVSELELDPNSAVSFVSAKTIAIAREDVVNPATKKVVVKEGRVFFSFEEIEKAFQFAKEISDDQIRTAFSKLEVILSSGEDFIPDALDSKGKVKTQGTISKLRELGINEFEVLYTRDNHIGDPMLRTVQNDGLEPEKDDLASHFAQIPQKQALLEIYKRVRPGDPPRLDAAEQNIHNLFFNPERYDLSPVGRLKLDFKLHKFKKGLEKDNKKGTKKAEGSSNSMLNGGVLTPDDIVETIRYLVELHSRNDTVNFATDDIDHLGNRRVRSVGELVENQYRIGLVRMERAIKERMSIQDIETLMPQDLINYKPVSGVLKEFFGSSQLSQFMDQTNPLSEITHKRRLSALGPGGLTRERAGFEVRDVHPTHYGRVCPIETPEGPNIGLISSLGSYARVNEFGFIETPYRQVEKTGKVTTNIVYLTAMEEEREVIAQASSRLDSAGKFEEEFVTARKGGEFVLVNRSEVTLMDVSPSQLVSVAASLIPFLENDDANRALMGSNMQRQAVPLVKTRAPLIGTGMEKIVARDSGATMVARRDGKVIQVDASRIVVQSKPSPENKNDTGMEIYNLIKYKRSNQSTCINQVPIVRVGDDVKKNDVIADGQSTEKGELALGQNVVVAFMPWGGYNFEDSILISEKVVRDDKFTSIHIEEFECIARDTKLGNEEITKDIPNVGEEALSKLDSSGIVMVGAEVKPGDILVGKITPKSETQLSPEEKLLRAIFGEKAGEVRDTSLRLPPGVEGTVVSAHVFSRRSGSKDDQLMDLEQFEIDRIEQEQRAEIKIIRESALKQVASLLKGQTTSAKLVDESRKQLLAKGVEITDEVISQIPFDYLSEIQVGDVKVEGEISRIVKASVEAINAKRNSVSTKIKRLKKGDDLPPGVIRMVKVFVAVKRRLSVGDKMAGRHGNKGVLSRVLPVEDMPYLPDGTPVDMVLNPLGVPSRMNVGQILETHLGWISYNIGRQLRDLCEEVERNKELWTEREAALFPVIEEGLLDNDLEQYRKETATPDVSEKENVQKIKDLLSLVHVDSETRQFISSLNDKEIVELAKKSPEGVHIASPVFEGTKENEIAELATAAGIHGSMKTTLFDGRTGEAFQEKVTVGIMYVLKLHHLVDDKIHARSTGPYSLVTQQPLGGKAQFGGQRLGEMEVWALEAYGAAYTLQEFLTVKSDDVSGRNRMYEAIVKGENVLEPGLPESFNVMCKELMSLGLNVELVEKDGAVVSAARTRDEKPGITIGTALAVARATTPTTDISLGGL